MSELQDMLRVQARLHRKQGANALGQLFESALEEIQLLKKTYNQLFDSFQNCHDALIESNERIAELEKENKRESMELRSRLGSALGRNSEYNSAIENMQQKLAKANERADKSEKEVDRLRSLFNKWKQEKDNAAWESHIVFEGLLSEMQACPIHEDGLSDKEWWESFVHQAINKFAIEKKIEGVNDFCASLQGYEDVQPIGANYVTSVASHRDSFTEQLRKEQE